MVLDIHRALVDDIDAFLGETGMSESYFGKVAAGNSEVLARLRSGRTITGATEMKLRQFMKARRGGQAA